MTPITRNIVKICLALLAGPAAALDLSLPAGARQVAGSEVARDSYELPTGPWNGETVPSVTTRGAVTRQVWRIETPGLTPMQVAEPLEQQLRADGFDILLNCADRACGGFDFRFNTYIAPAPDMYVDLNAFRFLSAQKQDTGDSLSLMVSQNLTASFVQLIHVRPQALPGLEIKRDSAPAPAVSTGPLADQMEKSGYAILADLTFETGSSTLGAGPFGTLEALAEYLLANPSRQVALVGHTDSVGSLDNNIALSKRRAASVADRLVTDYGVPRDQISAEGMGYLSPVASNLTSEGRETNRRVEAVLISTQ